MRLCVQRTLWIQQFHSGYIQKENSIQDVNYSDQKAQIHGRIVVLKLE